MTRWQSRLRGLAPRLYAVAWALFGFGAPLASAEAAQSDASSLVVDLRDGRVTLEASNAPLAEVFRALGRAGAFRVVIKGELDTPVTWSMANVTLDKALRRLAGRNSMVVRIGPVTGASLDDTPKILEVRLYPQSAARAAVVDGFEAALESRQATPSQRGLERRILKDLKQPQRLARIKALQRLRGLAPDTALDILADVLSNEADWFVRRRAVKVVGSVGGERAFDMLEANIFGDDAPVRIQALRTLSAVKSERTTDILGEVLLEHSSRQMRWAATQALAQHKDQAALDFLEAAAADPDNAVRQAVDRALGAHD